MLEAHSIRAPLPSLQLETPVLYMTMLLKLPPLLMTERAGQTRDSWTPLLSTVEAEESAFLTSSGDTGVTQSRIRLKRLSSSSSSRYMMHQSMDHTSRCSHTRSLCVVSHSVVSDSVRPYGLWPTRLLWPWDSPGKNTGVGWHFLLQGIFGDQGSNPHLLQWQAYSSPLSH